MHSFQNKLSIKLKIFEKLPAERLSLSFKNISINFVFYCVSTHHVYLKIYLELILKPLI